MSFHSSHPKKQQDRKRGQTEAARFLMRWVKCRFRPLKPAKERERASQPQRKPLTPHPVALASSVQFLLFFENRNSPPTKWTSSSLMKCSTIPGPERERLRGGREEKRIQKAVFFSVCVYLSIGQWERERGRPPPPPPVTSPSERGSHSRADRGRRRRVVVLIRHTNA